LLGIGIDTNAAGIGIPVPDYGTGLLPASALFFIPVTD
jgi:hypothetical protein